MALLCVVALCGCLVDPPAVRADAPRAATEPSWSVWEIAAAPDGTSRVLWGISPGTGDLVSIWKLDSAGRVLAKTPIYGPYTSAGYYWWSPFAFRNRAMVVASDGSTSLLWAGAGANTERVSIWKFDSDLNRTAIGPTYGPYPYGSDGKKFWAPYEFTAAPNGALRLVWSVEDEDKGPGSMGGIVSVWSLDAKGVAASMGPAYGPFSDANGDWGGGQYQVAPDGTARMLWVNMKVAAGQAQNSEISFWTLSPAGEATHYGAVYGPYSSWRPMNFDIDTTDSTLRLLWYSNTLPFTGNTPVSTWTLSTQGAVTAIGPTYGPYKNWHVTHLYANADGTSTLDWSNFSAVEGIQQGPFSFWTLDSVGQKSGPTPVYGPYGSWNLVDTARDPANDSFRLLWASGNPEIVSAWSLDAGGTNPAMGPVYGPYSLTP